MIDRSHQRAKEKKFPTSIIKPNQLSKILRGVFMSFLLHKHNPQTQAVS